MWPCSAVGGMNARPGVSTVLPKNKFDVYCEEGLFRYEVFLLFLFKAFLAVVGFWKVFGTRSENFQND